MKATIESTKIEAIDPVLEPMTVVQKGIARAYEIQRRLLHLVASPRAEKRSYKDDVSRSGLRSNREPIK
jgi:hypothetical protein